MNLQHLRAFVWLHWRLRVNQLTRGGVLNVVLLAIFAVMMAVMVVGAFVGAFFAGCFALGAAKPELKPTILLLAWDGFVIAFLFSWSIGLLQELQRTEALSLDKFLHLPVSLAGVFVLNYVSSLASSATLIVVVPAMVGFNLGLIASEGPKMLWLLPGVGAFVLMITALSYQFQGWLASLMVNKRRRRTVVVTVTMIFVLLCQLPNMVNLLQPWKHDKDWSKEKQEEIWQTVEQSSWYANLALPPGWLPLAAMGAAEDNPLVPILGAAGMALIGAASLWRAYKTTVRIYTGQYTAGQRVKPPEALPAPIAPGVKAEPQPSRWLETKLPWVSEQCAAIALASFRSLTRAPEAKMLLLTPIFLIFGFGFVFMNFSEDIPELVCPVMAFGAMAMTLFTLIQIVGNQFGFDRSGFRVYVLCPAPRREILLGKNLAAAPFALVLCVILAGLVATFFPMRLDHLFALVPQWLTMFLLFCMLANWMAILAPMAIASGGLKQVRPKFLTVMVQMLFVFALPVAFAPTMLPLGLEALLQALEIVEGVPIHLVLSVLLSIIVACVYPFMLAWQGSVLQSREQRILEVVAMKAE